MKQILKFFACIIGLPLLGRILYLVICSYSHNYTDKIWQPYQEGDSLEFFSNKGDTVKWGISQIKNISNSSDPLLLLNHRIYSTFVGTIRNFDAIIHIREELGNKTIYFEPRFRRGYMRVIANEKSQKNVTSIRYNQMNLLKITAHETDLRIEPFQDSIYWSTQYGYIKVFYSDGVIWELKSFEKNGQIIYELNN